MKPLYLLLLLSTLNHLSFVGARLATLLYAAYLGASPTLVGIIAALFAIVGAISSVSVGRWYDRVGPRAPMLISTVVMVAGLSIAFFWRDVAALVVLSLVVGTFHNVFHIGQSQLVGRYGEPRDRARNFSLSSLANSAASFLGPVIAGFSIDHIDHPWTFVLLAAIALIPLPFVVANLLEPPPAPAHPADHAHGAARSSAWGLLKQPTLRRVYVISVLANATWSVVNFLIPLYGIEIGLSASRIGTMMGFFAASTVVVRLALPLILKHMLPWQLMVASLFATGTGFLMMPFTQSYALLTALCAWIGVGLGLSGPMTMTILYEISPPGRQGEVIGMRVTIQNLCQVLVPLMSGAFGTAAGVGPVFWAFSAAILWGCFHNRGQLRRDRATLPP